MGEMTGESPDSLYARAMIAHALEPCVECQQLRKLIFRASPDADMGARFAEWCETVLTNRPSHAAVIEADFCLQEHG